MLGIWTAQENREMLDAIETRLRNPRLDVGEREDLTELRDELREWLADLWRMEGGGA